MSSLPELDDLLKESVELSQAKKAKNQGRKLSADQLETLEANRLATEALQWEVEGAVAHFIEETCECGSVATRFSSWYLLSTNKKKDQRRLVKADGHGGHGAWQHTTVKQVACCHQCLAAIGLPHASLSFDSILHSLGESVPVTQEQLVLDLITEHFCQERLMAELEETGEPSIEDLEAEEEEAWLAEEEAREDAREGVVEGLLKSFETIFKE